MSRIMNQFIKSIIEENMSDSNSSNDKKLEKKNRCVECTAPIDGGSLEETFAKCKTCIQKEKDTKFIRGKGKETNYTRGKVQRKCIYFSNGFCSKGDNCLYLHSKPNNQNTVIECKDQNNDFRGYINKSKPKELGSRFENFRNPAGRNMSTKKKLQFINGKYIDENGSIAICWTFAQGKKCEYTSEDCWYSHEEICACNSKMDWCRHELEWGICTNEDCKFRHSIKKNPCSLDSCEFNEKKQDSVETTDKSVKKEEEKLSQETYFFAIG